MFLADILSQEIQRWQHGDEVFISAPTGAGKTTFILDYLLPYASRWDREILYLTNRTLLHKQLIKKVCEGIGVPYERVENEPFVELDGITFATYQTVQERLSNDKLWTNLPFFHYVVLDEIHYIDSDSLFNPKTYRIEEWLKKCKCAVKIAVSATIEPALRYLGFYNTGWMEHHEEQFCKVYMRASTNVAKGVKGIPDWGYFYEVKTEAPEYQVTVFDQITDVVNLINEDESDEKWLLFLSSKDVIKKITSDIKWDVTTVTADEKGDGIMNTILESGTYDTKVLLATKVLDCGFSLHDARIKNIVMVSTDDVDFQQMLGRRRKTKDDKGNIKVFIPRLSKKFFWHQLKEYVEPTVNILELPVYQIMMKACQDANVQKVAANFLDFRDGSPIVNPIGINALKYRKRWLQMMIKEMELDPDAFVKYQLNWLGQANGFKDLSFLTECIRKEKLNALKGKLMELNEFPLDKDAQKKLGEDLAPILRILLPQMNIRTDRTLGVKKINDSFEILDIGYRIDSVGGKKKGETTKWFIKKVACTS